MKRHYRKRGMSGRELVEWILGECVIDGECVVWPYAKADGYGAIGLAGRMFGVHRLVYETKVERIPEGMMLDHMCRNRACCRLDHLRVVTPKQNTLENSISIPAIHAAKTECPKCGGEYSKYGRGRCCLSCMGETARATKRLYYIKNRARILAYSNAYNRAKRERLLQNAPITP